VRTIDTRFDVNGTHCGWRVARIFSRWRARRELSPELAKVWSLCFGPLPVTTSYRSSEFVRNDQLPLVRATLVRSSPFEPGPCASYRHARHRLAQPSRRACHRREADNRHAAMGAKRPANKPSPGLRVLGASPCRPSEDINSGTIPQGARRFSVIRGQ